jgi:hypothetical protein
VPEEPAIEVTELDDLYTLSLNRFIEARDALARRLRSEDRAHEAEEVAKLRKPSVAAWALNLASRSNPELVDRLLESHRLLREAGSGDATRLASEERRRAIASLTEAAMAKLRVSGRADSAQTRERVGETLLATATDPEAESLLRAGRLAKELEPSGSGWGQMGLAPVEVDPGKGLAKAAEQARARADRLEKEAVSAEHQLEIAEKAVKESRRRAKTLRAEAKKASAEADQAEKAAG